jgi:hypothetical protein
MLRWAAVVLLSSVTGVCASVGRQAEGSEPVVALDDVLSAWHKRSDLIRSARIRWRETQTIMKGAYLTPDMPEEINPERVYDPPENRTYVFLHELAFDRSRIVHRWWSPDAPEERTEVAFESGIEVRFTATPNRSNDMHPHASVRRAERSGEARTGTCAGVLRHFRALDPVMGSVDAQAIQLREGGEFIDGRPCVVVERRRTNPSAVEEYWVAPDMDFAILRFRRLEKGEIRSSVDFSYRRDRAWGWIPNGLSGMFTHGGQLNTTYESVVTDCNLNPELSAGDLSVEFPPGTVVTSVETLSSYLVLPNGGKRTLKPDEQWNATYERLMADTARSTMNWRSATIWLFAAAVVGVGAVGALVGAIWMRTRKRPGRLRRRDAR